MVNYIEVGNFDDATGPVRTRRLKKATNVAFTKGDWVSYQTGTAVAATTTTYKPLYVVYKDAATTDPDVEVFAEDCRCTIYVLAAANVVYRSFFIIDDNGKIAPYVYGTSVFDKVGGIAIKPAEGTYDGVSQPANTSDNDIVGIQYVAQ